MAKNTHSQEILTGTSDSYSDHESDDPNSPNIRINRPMLGEVDKPLAHQDGTDSSQLSESDSKSSASTTVDPHSPAPTTENPSSATDTADSIVDSTDGVGQEAEQNQSDEEEEIPPYEEWSVEHLRDECRQRGLIVSGNKSDLVTRLETDDIENELTDQA